jgi:KamA family protein
MEEIPGLVKFIPSHSFSMVPFDRELYPLIHCFILYTQHFSREILQNTQEFQGHELSLKENGFFEKHSRWSCSHENILRSQGIMMSYENPTGAVPPHTTSQIRMQQLHHYVKDYLEEKDHILTGFTASARIQGMRERILSVLGGKEEDWTNWKWHMHHRHLKLEVISKILPLSDQEYETYGRARLDSLVSVSPYFLSLVDPENPRCPIRLQILPHPEEYEDTRGSFDPSGELHSSPAPGWVQRYPDRGIILVNDIGVCPVACRFCQRRHVLSPKEPEHHNTIDVASAIAHIRSTPSIRDVLLTGGDALALADRVLERILRELRAIPHVEVIRLASRLPVTLPSRITPELCQMLSKYGVPGGHGAIWIVTHFNHPIEITPAAAQASLMLMSHGMPILNQSVLLSGINDHPYIMMRLNQEMVRIGVKPYYLFHCKSLDGALHFRTPLKTGLDIIQFLNGRTSGFALPYYVISLRDGKGKVRLTTPEQLHPTDTPGVWRITTWEGEEELYDER